MVLEQLKTSILATLVLSALTGLVYPLVTTGLAQGLFPYQANGSLMRRSKDVIGSPLIGQPFDDPKYFWSRISATGPTPYNAASSSGSNLGPTNPALRQEVQGRIDALHKADPSNTALVPVDLVTSSASGLDPHITPAAALYQAARVARVRHFSKDRVATLIQENTDGRFLGILGEAGVNVLKLNLALDRISN